MHSLCILFDVKKKYYSLALWHNAFFLKNGILTLTNQSFFKDTPHKEHFFEKKNSAKFSGREELNAGTKGMNLDSTYSLNWTNLQEGS
jgi:hypothetical protein